MLNPLAEKLKNNTLILASQSPRRRMLLKEMGLTFITKVKDTNESFPQELNGREIAEFLSKKKSDTFFNELQKNEIIITADTIVWLHNKVLNKPKNTAEAIEMLQLLSGSMHTVYTGVTLCSVEKNYTFSSCTNVWFKNLSANEILYYTNQFNPTDKAGAYGIQEWIGFIGVEKIEGCFFNVMGLPTSELYSALWKF
ncbi:MAG: septum formation protein Maf [Bacteroidetes bacterium]|nr:septum formation protein Maf [Bacteroidota bacterium]MBV6461968.1 Septum formation protein Maf [Flavobacteriales bacterium]WKZ76638.1 MAG: Maf family nucleotide pyrophosphatase [Vicingaceae bacterium]MCL4815541.1 septum formation protein Maf [Flavobacteriales bacterium]NOG94320.1 septum formation protein Maf [Bacteroidota bacterium]